MNKEEWQSLYNNLERSYNDFQSMYNDSVNGRNKDVRKKAEKKIGYAIDLADRYIRQNHEAYILLTGENNSDYGRAINYDEFTNPTYFGNDMSEFLDRIKEKIASFGE